MKSIVLCFFCLVLTGFTTFTILGFGSEMHGYRQSNTAKSLTEDEKVAHLLNYLRGLDGAVFIRNSKEFNPAEAADHLGKKWEKHKKRVKTAEGFVNQLATESTNKIPYQIKLSDGQTVKCCDLLREELKKIDG